METDLPSLIERARRLDRYALEELHDLYYPAVYRYICFRLDDPQDCQDIAAQVFQQFLQTLAKRRPLAEQPLSYLLSSAAQAVNNVQKIPKKPGAQGREIEGATPEHTITKDSNQSQSAAGAAIRQLKPKHQHMLAIRFTSKISLEKTAQLMDEPIQKVRGYQWRALQALQRGLNKEGLG